MAVHGAAGSVLGCREMAWGDRESSVAPHHGTAVEGGIGGAEDWSLASGVCCSSLQGLSSDEE